MHEPWSPRNFAQYFIEIMRKYLGEEEGSLPAQKVLAKKCGVSATSISRIFAMGADESDGESTHHKQPAKKTLDSIARNIGVSEEERLRLWELAGHVLPSGMEIERSPAQIRLAQLLDDIAAPLKENLEADIDMVVKGWRAYGEARTALHQRQWDDVIGKVEYHLPQVESQMQQLPGYLRDVQAIAHLHCNEVDEANELLIALTRSSLSNKQFPHLYASILLHRGDIQREKAQWDAARMSYQEACDILESRTAPVRDEKLRIRAERKMAVVELFKGDWRNVPAELHRCLSRFEALDDGYELARTHQSLGWAYELEGRWQASRHHRLQALTLAKQHRVEGQKDYHLIMLSRIHLGSDCRKRNQLERARLLIGNALDLAQKYDEQRYEWFAHLEMAQIDLQQWQNTPKLSEVRFLENAYSNAQKAYERYPKNSSYHYAMVRAVLGKVYLAQARHFRNHLPKAQFMDTNGVAADGNAQNCLNDAKKYLEEALRDMHRLQCYQYEAQLHALLCEWHLEENVSESGDYIAEEVRKIERLDNQFSYPYYVAQAFMLWALYAIQQGKVMLAVDYGTEAWYHANEYNEYALVDMEEKFHQMLHLLLRYEKLPQDDLRELYRTAPESQRNNPPTPMLTASCFCYRVIVSLENHSGMNRSRDAERERMVQIVHVLRRKARALGGGHLPHLQITPVSMRGV